MFRRPDRLLLLFLLLSVPFAHGADDPDRDQPIEIRADSLKASQKEGVAHYLGHVIITQGRLTITGDTLTVTIVDGKIRKAVVIGQPARFKKFDYEKKRWIHGHAHTITYTLKPERQLRLEKAAHIESETGEQLNGAVIRYWPDSQRLEADGGKGRVKLVLPPQAGETP